MKKNTRFLITRPAGAFLLLVTLAALIFLSLQTDNASYAQTESSEDLASPTLTAQAGDGAIELSWTAVTGAARYEIRAYTVEDEWIFFDYTAQGATSYTHTEITAGRTYYYWVRGVSEAGETGAWSVRTNATAPASASAPGDADTNAL